MSHPIASIIIGAIAVGGGVGTGFGLVAYLKPPVTTYLVDTVNIDYELAKSEYDKAKSSGDFSSMRVDLAFQMAFYRFDQEEQHYTIGVGSSIASIVTQAITARSVRDGKQYFEESNSTGIVNLYDRMYEEGDTTTTYWGASEDYGSHEKKIYTNDEYRQMMGKQVSSFLCYVVAPETLSEENLSGDGLTSIAKTEDGYKIEVELDPKTGVSNYQKQMQTISDLKYKPTFEYCHLTVYTDANLDLKRFVTHEKYMATTSAGVGSMAEGSLTTVFYHNTLPDYGFPSPGDKLPAFPEKL